MSDVLSRLAAEIYGFETSTSKQAIYTASVRDNIAKLLADIERERNVRILYACESGGRAWGFHSEDSDYDI